MRDLREKMIGGVAWSVFQAIATQALAFFSFLMLARLLSPEDFGSMALANLYVYACQILIAQGFGEAIVQFKSVDSRLLNSAFWTINAIAAGLVGATFLLSHPIAQWFGDERLSLILRWLSPALFFSSLISLPFVLLARELRFRTIAKCTFASCLAGGLVGIAMACAGFGVWSLVGQQLAGGLCNTAMFWRNCDRWPRLEFSFASLRTLVRFGSNICGIQALGQVARRSDQFFIGKYLGIFPTGIYAIASRMGTLANEILVSSVTMVTYSALSRIQEDIARSLNGFYRVIQVQSCLTLPLFLGVSLLAPEVVSLCLGPKWTDAVPAIQILMLSGPFNVISEVIGATIIAGGKPNRLLWLTGVHAAVNVTLFAIVVRWGILAVAAAYVLRAAVMMPVELAFLRTVLPVKITKIIRIFAPLVFAAAVMCGAVALVRFYLDGRVSSAIVATTGIAVGAVSYAGILGLLQRTLFMEILRHLDALLPLRLRKYPATDMAHTEVDNLPHV